jgi:hypothetical protein
MDSELRFCVRTPEAGSSMPRRGPVLTFTAKNGPAGSSHSFDAPGDLLGSEWWLQHLREQALRDV